MLLDRLTRLEGEIQSRQADNHYRLSAAQAYYEYRRPADRRSCVKNGVGGFCRRSANSWNADWCRP